MHWHMPLVKKNKKTKHELPFESVCVWSSCVDGVRCCDVMAGRFIKASFLGLGYKVSQAPHCLTCPRRVLLVHCVINETAGRREQWSLQWHIVLSKIASGDVPPAPHLWKPQRNRGVSPFITVFTSLISCPFFFCCGRINKSYPAKCRV